MSNPTELPDLDILFVLRQCADALAYAAYNYDGSKLEYLNPRLSESTGVAETALIAERCARNAISALARRAQPEDEVRREYTEAVAREAWAVVCNNSKGMPDNMQAAIRDALLAPLYSHSPAAKPEGEAPQAELSEVKLGQMQYCAPITVTSMTLRKREFLEQKGYSVVGYVMQNAKQDLCTVAHGKVEWREGSESNG